MKRKFYFALQKLLNEEDNIQHSLWCFLLALEVPLRQQLLHWAVTAAVLSPEGRGTDCGLEAEAEAEGPVKVSKVPR